MARPPSVPSPFCSNYGEITAAGGYSWQSYVGGIVGRGAFVADYCVNYGTIYASGEYGASLCPAGGISGDGGTIRNCINCGFIKGQYKGGISGLNNSEYISNCVNYGVIEPGSYAGSIFCTDSSSSSQAANKNNYQLLETSNKSFYDGYYNTGGVRRFRYSELNNLINLEDFKDNKNISGLDFENVWFCDALHNSGLPQLRNMPIHIDLNECIELFGVGDSDRLYAYIDGNSETVTWSCDNTSIATVSSSGIVTAKSIGTCTVTATNSEGMKANCLIFVYGRASSMQLSNDEININENKTYTLSPAESPNTANENVIWHSEDESIATVDQGGVVTGKAKGTTTVYAITTQSNIRANCTVHVSAPITSISLSATSKSIKLGDTDSITSTISPKDYEGGITWDSSDNDIVSVDKNGNITANKVGTAYITATASSGVTARCTVTKPATSIKINKAAITTYVGAVYQLSATVLPSDTTDTVTWSSNNTSYATVSNNGLVTGQRAGTATITARTSSGLTATCSVTVKQQGLSLHH